MRKIWLPSLMLLAIGLLLATAADVRAKKGGKKGSGDTPITACPFTISTPGAFSVQKDLTATGDCIVITASGVKLKLNGFTIMGPGTTNVGIKVVGTRNVNIDPGNVEGFEDGVLVLNSTNIKVEGVVAKRNTRSGIRLEGSDDNEIERNIAFDNGSGGIQLVNGSDNNKIKRNEAFSNGSGRPGDGGITLADSSENEIEGNNASSNDPDGIALDTSSDDNEVEDNIALNNAVNDITDAGSGNEFEDNLCENGSPPALCPTTVPDFDVDHKVN